jgi:hypothetical protein
MGFQLICPGIKPLKFFKANSALFTIVHASFLRRGHLNELPKTLIMSMLRKILIGSVMMMTVLTMSVVVAPQAKAAASAGDLIKISGLSSVYYLGANNKRYVFPNEATYFSWYKDFSGVVTIPQSEMEGYPLAANVVMRSGTKLIKSPSINTVYAVEPNGVLRSIVSEANAINLWGANWAKKVVDVIDSFFVNYTVGAPLTLGQYPVGQLIKTSGSPDVMLLAADGTVRKFASEASFTTNNYNFNYVETVPSAYVMPSTGAAVAGSETALSNVAQSGYIPGPVAGGSSLSAALASDTPAAGSIAENSSVAFLKFNLTASNDGAANVSAITLTAGGLGAVSAITKVVLYADGTRIGNEKAAVDSNRKAIFNLSTPLNIPAGQTKSVLVKAVVTDANQHTLSIAQASDINASGATVAGSFPLSGNIMSGVNITVGALTLTGDGDPADVNLGDIGATIGKFKLVNDNVEDITLSSITVQRSAGTSVNADFQNVALYYNGSKIADSTGFTGKSNGYATFKLASPMVITKNKTVKFEVKADIADGRSGDTTTLSVDSASDIEAVGSVYGQSANVTTTSFYQITTYAAATGFVINAGTIALAKVNAAVDKIKASQTGAILGTLKITSNSGASATLQTLRTTITSTNDHHIALGIAFDAIENIKLIDQETGMGYDLDYVSGTNAKLFGLANNVDMTLVSGHTYTFDIKADTLASSTDETFIVSIATAATDVVVKDNNNSAISDITPSSLSFNSVTIQAPAVTFSLNALSTALSQVVGTSNVEALNFNMKANATSNLTVIGLAFAATSTISGGVADEHVIAQARLYKDGDATPIKSVTGSNIPDTNIITFSGLSLNIPANQTVKYYLIVDITNNSDALNNTTLQLGLEGYTINDSDNNSVYDVVTDPNSDGVLNPVLDSARVITCVASGYLSIETDNTNINTNKAKYEIAGTASTGYLAAFKMRSGNENVKIEDLTVYVYDPTTGTGNANANKMFSSLSLVDENGGPIPGGTVGNVTASTTFTGINLEIPQSTKTYYLKGVLNPIGQNKVGVAHASATFAIADVVAKGVSSSNTLVEATTTSCSATKVCYNIANVQAVSERMATANSLATDVLASRISAVALVDSAPGCSRATYLSGGWNNAAIIKVTTDADSNTIAATGDDVQTLLTTIQIDYTKNSGTVLDNWTIEKCNGVDGAVTNSASTTATATFTLTSLTNDRKINKSSTVYFVAKAYATTMETDVGDWVQADLGNLDGSATTANFGWQDTSDATLAFPLRLSVNKIDGVKIVEQP